MKTKFVTMEGCEGVGKTTQVRLLQEYLQRTGQAALFTREPGGTLLADRLRELLLSPAYDHPPLVEAYLFACARAEHVQRVIRPALLTGELVVCDRFLDSSLAYQGEARGLGFEQVEALNRPAVADCMPNCTLFFDMDPSLNFRKQKGKVVENDRMEAEDEAFHKRVYRGFCKLADAHPDRIVRIVPTGDKIATHNKVLDVLRARGLIR